ncbi:anti-sigma factor domain-containing protein [Neobacillus sp. D3-1R]|uniref:anti-sigma factor domain-containing protein n=1 Tax=Neobacillus sp. D3-1R TaxID=3445778 RepID=UPI003FA1037A
MKKGIVMEIDRRFLTLLTPEGEFLKARKEKQEYIIGQEIDFFPINVVPKKSSLFYQLPGKKALVAAMFAIVIASASFLPMSGSNDVYAYMSIDVNPSIELAVNEDLEVVSMEAYNPEGKLVISEIDNWKKKDVSAVTTQIIEKIKEQGFFENHDEVVISTVYEDKKQDKIEKKLEEDIEMIEKKVEEENLQLTVVQGTKEEREEAHKQGITTGKLKENQPSVEKKIENKQKSTNKQKPPVEKNNTPKSDKKSMPKNDQSKKENHPVKGKAQAPGQLKKSEEKSNEKKSKVDKKDKSTHNSKKKMNNQSDDNDELYHQKGKKDKKHKEEKNNQKNKK